MKTVFKVGTRKSKLALIQTDQVIAGLKKLYPEIQCEKVYITTKGDADRKTSLKELGGQGVFVKKIQQALLNGEIDFAVHSAKDMPSKEAEGLVLAAFLNRASVNDCLLTKGATLESLPKGAVVGTSSLRRHFQLLQKRPDLVIKNLRGNIETRLEKLIQEEYDGIIMAKAGLERYELNLEDKKIKENILPLEDFLPAVGQGAIAVECKKDSAIAEKIQGLNDEKTFQAVSCERAFLSVFGVGCNVPIAAFAEVFPEKIILHAQLGNLENQTEKSLVLEGKNPVALGLKAGEELKKFL